DLRTFEKSITLQKDQETRITAELRYAPPPVSAASKSLLSVDEAPASTTVITSEEIRAFGYTSVAEALQAVRGFFLSDDRMYTYLGTRGFAPPGDLNTRVLILWDGHAMNDVWAGQGYAARDLTADIGEVDRIEVVRGPGSALYGTALGIAGTRVLDTRGFAEVRYDKQFAESSLSARAYYDASRYRGYWVQPPADESSPPGLQTDSGAADWVGAELRGRFLLF